MSSPLICHFEPLDTWFFRQARPHGSMGNSELGSQFPPPVRTLLGALRTAIGDAWFARHGGDWRGLADNNGSGTSLDKYGFAADYRWGIGSRDEFEVNFFYLQNDNGINYGLPYIRKSATNAALTTIPVDPSSYYGTQSDYNHGSAGYATFAHTHRFSADTELVTKIRKGDFNRDQRASTVRIAGAALQPDGVLATRENFSSATVLTRGVQNKIQSMENLFAQSDLSTKFEALGLKHEVLTGVDFAWEKKIVRGARSAAQGGVDINKPTTTIGDPDNGIAPGTKWEDLPADWVCPLCGAGKDEFTAK